MTPVAARTVIAMPTPLKALVVDDDPADVELERAALRHDFTVALTRVDSADTFSAALRSGQFDIVLCDYAMPHFSGMEALALWQATGAQIPLIFVTGRLSEEVAVDCIKAGATDYVLKANLARLPTAVDRALRELAAARALRQAEAERSRVVAAVEQAEEIVLIADPDGTIVYVNPAFTRITGYRPEEAIGQTPRLLRSGKNAPALYADLWQHMREGQVWRGQLINRRRDGTLYDAELTVAPVFDATGRIVNFSAIQRDVSERVAAERRLRELYAELAETDRLKDEFLAAFSHELRSPLHVILGYADILRETVGEHIDTASRNMLSGIERTASHLAVLINETLDLARLRIGALQPRFVAVDVGALVQEVGEAFTPLATSKGLTFSCEIPPAPIPVTTDPLRVREILGNLVDNAIKFTDRGEVRLHAACANGDVVLEVRDTGIGVAAADIPHMFEDFRQLDGSSTRRHGGCGLGLAVCKRLLALLDGRIEVESIPGRGSCFRVQLPREPTAATRARAESPVH